MLLSVLLVPVALDTVVSPRSQVPLPVALRLVRVVQLDLLGLLRVVLRHPCCSGSWFCGLYDRDQQHQCDKYTGERYERPWVHNGGVKYEDAVQPFRKSRILESTTTELSIASRFSALTSSAPYGVHHDGSAGLTTSVPSSASQISSHYHGVHRACRIPRRCPVLRQGAAPRCPPRGSRTPHGGPPLSASTAVHPSTRIVPSSIWFLHLVV